MESEVQCLNCSWEGDAVKTVRAPENIVLKNDRRHRCPACGSIRLKVDKGDSKSAMAKKAERRPSNYTELSAREQWDIDKRLGILDWDGS